MMSNAELFAFIRKNPISFSCGALSVALGLAIYFRSSALPVATKLLETRATEGERLATNVRNSAQLSEQYTAITDATKAMDAQLVRADELAQNLQYFYRLEAETGTKLIELRQVTSPSTKRPASAALTGIAFTATVRGEYFAVLEFLRRLESGPHFGRITAATLGTSELDRSGPITFSVGVELLGQL